MAQSRVKKNFIAEAIKTDTANNDISAVGNNSWFILTDGDTEFKYFQRMPAETDTYPGALRETLKVKKGNKIPESKLEKATHSNLAETLKKLRNKK